MADYLTDGSRTIRKPYAYNISISLTYRHGIML